MSTRFCAYSFVALYRFYGYFQLIFFVGKCVYFGLSVFLNLLLLKITNFCYMSKCTSLLLMWFTSLLPRIRLAHCFFNLCIFMLENIIEFPCPFDSPFPTWFTLFFLSYQISKTINRTHLFLFHWRVLSTTHLSHIVGSLS